MRRRRNASPLRLKRSFDIVAATLALVVSFPVSALAATAIALTSRGGVLHRATRVGKDGVPFTLLKFRTMRVVPFDSGPGITSADDPRITPIGRLLRRFKIDELPQLVNVIRGDMSIVGPRPEDPRYVAGYTDEQRRVLSVRPGITSPASIAYRDEERLIRAHTGDRATFYRDRLLPAKLAVDLEYLDRRSLWTDLAVLMKTALGLVWAPRSGRPAQ